MSLAPLSLGVEFFLFLLRVFGLTLALMLTVSQKKTRINSILLIFLLTLLLHSLSMYWQWYSGWDITYRVQINGSERLSGSVFNPNPFGLFMSLAVVLAGYFALISQGTPRYINLIFIVLFSVSLYKSESRGAILGLLVALFTVTLSLPYSRTWGWLLITTKLVAAGIAVWGFSLHVQRPGSDDVRWSALQHGYQRSLESPWIGCGWQCTEASAIVQGADGVHNVFLDIALLVGWPVALIFCASLTWLFYKTRLTRDALTNALRAMLALLLAAGLFDYSVLTSKMYLGAFICLVSLFWLSAFRNENRFNHLLVSAEGSH